MNSNLDKRSIKFTLLSPNYVQNSAETNDFIALLSGCIYRDDKLLFLSGVQWIQKKAQFQIIVEADLLKTSYVILDLSSFFSYPCHELNEMLNYFHRHYLSSFYVLVNEPIFLHITMKIWSETILISHLNDRKNRKTR